MRAAAHNAVGVALLCLHFDYVGAEVTENLRPVWPHDDRGKVEDANPFQRPL